MVQSLTILGSTGSVGRSTLDVVARHPSRYKVVALTANSGVQTMRQQCHEFKPQIVAMADVPSAEEL